MHVKRRFKKAAAGATRHGFVQPMTRHIAFHFPRGPRLLVTFDNMKSRDMTPPVYPWGYDYAEKHGFSHLGICMIRRNDWFMHADVAALFERLAGQGFFAGHDSVAFYGSSMGGFGALTFARVAPGARVVAFAPQTTLDPERAPFETRFKQGYLRGDWTGRFADAATGLAQAERVTIFADPYFAPDAAHMQRLSGDNLVWARTPFAGHSPARLMQWMDILGPASAAALEGTLTEPDFAAMWRGARGTQARARAVLNRALERDHPRLVNRALDDLSRSRPEWRMPLIRRMARKALAQGTPTHAARAATG